MVRSLTIHGETPDDGPRLDVDGNHIGEARPGHDEVSSVVGGVHVVGVLIVSLTDELPNAQIERGADRVTVDLGDSFVLVRYDVDATVLRELTVR